MNAAPRYQRRFIELVDNQHSQVTHQQQGGQR